MRDLVQRVVDRFAARSVTVKPMELGCRHCGGKGMHEDKGLKVKSTCIQCFGTGANIDAVEDLRKEVDRLGDQYRKDKAEFAKVKKPYRGRSVRQFGTGRGMDLQTLRITWTAREDQLKDVEPRIKLGLEQARMLGAAAASRSVK